MSGTVRVIPVPQPPDTVSRFAWVWLEDKQPRIGYPYPTEDEARRVGHPLGRKAALLELVLPRAEILAAIQSDDSPEVNRPAT